MYHVSNGCRFPYPVTGAARDRLLCDVQGSSIVTYDNKCIFHIHGKDLYNPSNNVCRGVSKPLTHSQVRELSPEMFNGLLWAQQSVS